MVKQNKYTFWKGTHRGESGVDINQLQNTIRQNKINKYYNLWMSKFKWTGLDEENKEQQENYIMRKAWSDGLIAVRPIENTDMLAFTTWTTFEWNMYDFPEKVNLVNLRGVSSKIIPATPQVVNKDVVIGWFQPNHKPIKDVVQYYVDRMTQVEMIINTNLTLQNLPFLIGVTEDDKKKMQDVVDRILNNEVVVFADMESLAKIQTLSTSTPYIIDRLRTYLIELEEELLTYLGIDNKGGLDKTHLTIDTVNANNDLINQFDESIISEINKWTAQVERVFGRKISIELAVEPRVQSLHEDVDNKEVEADE